jgi:hypothetical protein
LPRRRHGSRGRPDGRQFLFQSSHLDLGRRRRFRFNLERLKLTAHALEQHP